MSDPGSITPVMMPMPSLGGDLNAYAARGRPNDPRAINAAATKFEGVFVSLLMKEMRKTLSDGSLFSGDKGDVLGGLFDHFLGQHLAQAGALGIANLVKKSWQMRGNHGQQQTIRAGTVAGQGHHGNSSQAVLRSSP